ncbi:Protein N-terminal and lysine N-methyltransferase efm7 [Lecanicillium sp. MT-2017a]|nr:Protein N-terminal and lysine N-methyltransferase efm7 [Lecanicillium sp. MT-2017a]
MSSTKPAGILEALKQDGFIVIKNIVSDAKLQELRETSLKIEKLARAGEWPYIRTVGDPFPPWTFSPEKGIWGVQHLMNPDLPGHDLYTSLYFSEEILAIAREIMQCQDDELVMELFNMLLRPESDFALQWHRDAVPADATAEEEMERLRQPAFHAQYNFALWEDDSLVVVPGSHKRPRTDTERNADPFAKELPDQLIVKLGPGDIVFYYNNILHRGVYDAKKQRVTLHGSVGHSGGSNLRAYNILKHGIGSYVENVDFSKLEGQGKDRAEAMRKRLIKLANESAESVPAAA